METLFVPREDDDDAVLLSAPNPVEVKKERSSTSTLIWSSGSDASSNLNFGTVPVPIDRSVTQSPTQESSDSRILEAGHQNGAAAGGPVHEYVSTALETLERKLEVVLDSISDELTSEVIRERQHLLLMQEKVDMQGQTLQREFTELNKKMSQESTIRAMVQQKYREQNDAFGEDLRSITREIASLKEVINKLETPWMYRAMTGLFSVFHQCSGSGCSQYEPLRNGEDPE